MNDFIRDMARMEGPDGEDVWVSAEPEPARVRTRAELRRNIVFHGELGKRFGKNHAMAGATLQEVVQGIDELRDGRLRRYLCDETPERKLGFRVWLDGEEVPPDRMSVLLKEDTDTIEIAPFPLAAGKAGGWIQAVLGVIVIIIGIILIETPIGWALIAIGVGMLASGVSALLAPGVPQTNTGGGGAGGFGFQSTIQGASQGTPKPIVWGEAWVAGMAVSASSRAAGHFENDEFFVPGIKKGQQKSDKGDRPIPDFFLDAERVVVDLLGEGELEGFVADPLDSIRLNETKLRDMLEDTEGNLSFEFRTGTATQDPLVSAPSPETEIAVGIELLKNRLVSRDTTIGSALRAVRVNIVVNQLIHTASKGEAKEHLDFTITVKDNASGLSTSMSRSYWALVKQRRNLSFEIPVSGTGNWTVTVKKTSDDTEGSHYRGVTWEGFTEISNAQLRYPGSALVAMKWRASQIPGNVERRYHMKGMKCRVPSNYVPDGPPGSTYVGDWDGTFAPNKVFTRNPIWQTCEYLTNRQIGLGRHVSDADINWLSAYRAAVRCDEPVSDQRGGVEFRHTFNLHDTSRTNAWRKLLEHLSAAYTVPFYDGHRISFSQDRPGSVRDVVTPESVIDGSFQYSGAGLKDLSTRVVVQYANEEDLDRAGSEVVEDPGLVKVYGIISNDVRAVGIRSRSEAQRFAYWMLLMEQDGEGVSFIMGPHAQGYLPGDILNIYDPDRGISYVTGLTAFAEANALHLDKNVTIEAGTTYRLIVPQPNYRLDTTYAKNALQVLLNLPLAGDDPELVTVRQDWDGDGEYEIVRSIRAYDSALKRVDLGPEPNATNTVVPTRIEWMLPVYTADVTNAPGVTDRVTLDAPFDLPPTKHTPWVLKKPNQDGELWRVAARVERDDQITSEVTCIKYNPTRYDKIDALPDFPAVPIEHEPIPAFGSAVPPPMSAQAFIERRQVDGRAKRVVGVAWSEPSRNDRNRNSVTGYEVVASRNGEPGHVVGELVRLTEFFLVEPDYGVWNFWVRSIDVEMRKSKPVQSGIEYDEHSAATGAGLIVGLHLLGPGDGSTAVSKDFDLAWSYQELGADGEVFETGAQAPDTVDAFVIEVWDTKGGGLLRHFETRGFNWTYTNDMNRADQASLGRHAALRNPRFRAWVRDASLADGKVVDLFASNPARRAPAGIQVSSTPGSSSNTAAAIIHVEVAVTGESFPPPDAAGMAVWASTTPGFTPGTGTFKGRATGNFLSFPATSNTRWYVLVGLYDTFNGDPSLLEDPASEIELAAEETLLTIDGATFPVHTYDMAPGAITDTLALTLPSAGVIGGYIASGGKISITGSLTCSDIGTQSWIQVEVLRGTWYPDAVKFFNGTSYDDYTAQNQGAGSIPAPVLQTGNPETSEALYIGNVFRCGDPRGANALRFAFSPGIFADGSVFVVEYWNGLAFVSVPGLVDETDGCNGTFGIPTGYMTWNVPPDWQPRTVGGGASLFYFRIRQIGAPGTPSPQSVISEISGGGTVAGPSKCTVDKDAFRTDVGSVICHGEIRGTKATEQLTLSVTTGYNTGGGSNQMTPQVRAAGMVAHAGKDPAE